MAMSSALSSTKTRTDEERRISEINTGIYCFVIADLAQVIDQLSAENSQREYYLTDCVGLLKKQNKRVSAVVCEDPSEVSGINSRAELAELERIVRQKKTETAHAGWSHHYRSCFHLCGAKCSDRCRLGALSQCVSGKGHRHRYWLPDLPERSHQCFHD